MNTFRKIGPKRFGKATVAAALLGSFLVFAGAPSAKANNWDDEDRRIDRTEWKLRQAIEKQERQRRERWERERREHHDRYDHHDYPRDRD